MKKTESLLITYVFRTKLKISGNGPKLNESSKMMVLRSLGSIKRVRSQRERERERVR